MKYQPVILFLCCGKEANISSSGCAGTARRVFNHASAGAKAGGPRQ